MKAYRFDIDGLRAIAVLAVVYFHINPRKFEGGFLGVDMFFVISGFLITGITWAALEDGKFSLKEFYAKRIRRLFPAFFSMLFFSLIAVLIIGLPDDVYNFSKSAIASTFYVSNIYFWSVSDYFNDTVKSDLLLHTWSLSVEEQFYIFFPLFLLAVHKFLRHRVVATLIVSIVIFCALSELLLGIDPSMAFYLSPSRFWQFLMGGILVFVPLNRVGSPKVATWISAISLLTLLVCMREYSDELEYPGINSILPTLATAALLYFGGLEGNKVSNLLSTSLFRFVGLISYSVYLWHWPLIVLFKMEYGSPDSLEMWGIFFATILLGYLSWKFVEQPFRKHSVRSKMKSVYLSGITLMFAASSISLVLFVNKGFDNRYNQDALIVAKYLQKVDTNKPDQQCFWTTQNGESLNKKNCLLQDPTKRDVLLLGDSHMAHYVKSFVEMFPDIAFSRVTGPGCRFLLPVKKSTSCRGLMEPVLEEYVHNYKFDSIIISGRWKYHELDKFEAALEELMQYHKNEIIVFGPIIEYEQSFPRLVLKYFSEEDFDVLVDEHNKYEKIRKVDLRLREIAEKKGIKYFSVLDALCSNEGVCKHLVEKEPVHSDYGHVTYFGAQHVLSLFKEKNRGLVSFIQ